jgi:ParB/RepB/Spo0J family partition protein
MITEELKSIPLAQIAPSPTNPRKTFDAAKLQELANSIGTKGLIQPIVVRPYPALNPAGVNPNGKGLPKYELVAGERRFRASKLASLETILSVVRELDDVQVLEIQTIENLQRDDVHPLEEADGYAALMKSAGYDVDQIAAKIGKSTKYVYDRIKLLQLIPAAKKYFLDGEITAGHAIQLARLSKDDQERIVGDGDTDVGSEYRITSIFVNEDSEPTLEFTEDVVRRKAVSVRELAKLIDERVRFRPAEVDLANLFPETAVALKAAEEEELKVVMITRSYRCPDAARDEREKTYGGEAWKRADGQPEIDQWSGKEEKSKTCDHSVMGVVVAGHGRGEAFRVCVAKKKCKVHWAAEIREAEKPAKERSTSSSSSSKAESKKPSWQIEQERRQAEEERWEKAAPSIREAVREKLAAAPALVLLEVVLAELFKYRDDPKGLKRGTSIEDGLRFAAAGIIDDELDDPYHASEGWPKLLKPLGIDAKKIVDEVAPKEKPKPEKKEKAKATTKKAKAGA